MTGRWKLSGDAEPVLPFVIASLAVLLTPGPTNTILAASGAAMGLRKSLYLPVAEALGYAIAISLFLSLEDLLRDVPAALPIMKAIAAAWLLWCAVRLWSQPVAMASQARRGAFWRVLSTTMLNPKAMLVGTVIIPGLLPDARLVGLLCFIVLSTLAGFGWTALGSAVPVALRKHAYRAAAVIVAAFSVAAAASLVHA